MSTKVKNLEELMNFNKKKVNTTVSTKEKNLKELLNIHKNPQTYLVVLLNAFD